MKHEMPKGYVPIWELHIHLWSVLSKGKFVSGKDFLQKSIAEKEYAIQKNAEIIVEWGHRLNFSAVSITDSPWDCVYTVISKCEN